MRLDSEKVRWHRDRLGWTLDTLAEQAEVAEGTALRAEHGEDIRPSSGRRIARAFGVDLSELVPEKPGVVLPKGTAPSTSGQPEEERPTVREIARNEARRQFELDSKAVRRTFASEGLDHATRISDVYDPAAYDALRRQPDEAAGALLDAERHSVYLEHENADLKQENADLKQEITRLREETSKLREQTAHVE